MRNNVLSRGSTLIKRICMPYIISVDFHCILALNNLDVIVI